MRKALFLSLLLAFVSVSTYAQKVKVIENSKIAKYAARLNKKDEYAVTIGRRIFINCSKEEFFASPSWVRHELIHVDQYGKHGIVIFLTRYLFHSIFHKYENNPLEKEAIKAEFSSQ
jgi:hypothetical protein